MILSIGLGILSAILGLSLYNSRKKEEDIKDENLRLNRLVFDLEKEIWDMRIDLQDSKNQVTLAKMEHEKTKQELEDKAKVWENQYNQLKTKNVKSKSSQSKD